MRLTQAQQELLKVATAQRIAAASAYKRAWTLQPTAKGYPTVDRALTRLESAEAMERAAEAGILPLDAFAQANAA